MTAPSDLKQLVTARDFYAAGRTGDVFPTYQAFSFFLRRHATELCEHGVFIPRQGSAGSLVDSHGIGKSIREIMAREGALLVRVLEQ